MNSNSPLFTTSPEDLVLRIKTGDAEAALTMGLMCLSGLGLKQNLDQAFSYFAKAKQLGAKNADAFIGYIHECNDRMIKAIEIYVEKDSPGKKDSTVAERISHRFATVRSERKKLSKILSDYGLPECPISTSLNNMLEDLDSGRRSLTDICSIISLTDADDRWCHDTAWLYFEEGNDCLASMWLKKSHPDPDDNLLKLIQIKSNERPSCNADAIEIKGDSLLEKKLIIKIMPEDLFTSGDTFKKALSDWSLECNQRKDAFGEGQRCQEEEAKKKAEEEARRCAEERSFIVGRYGRQRDEILDKTVSRKHCRVSLLDDGMVEIENLSQSNGTVVNGEKIEKVKTSMDSELKLGNYFIKVRDLFPPRKSPTEANKETTA